MAKSLEQLFTELYISNLDIIGEGLPAYVNSARRGFLENFNILSLPSKKSENYRHSDMRELFEGDREYYFTPSVDAVNVTGRVPVAGYTVDVVNGFHDGEAPLVTLDNGIVYGSLREAMSEMGDVVAEYYNTAADNENDAVTALNSVFMQDGAFVYIPRGTEADRPFVLTFEYGSAEQAQMSFSRALVIAEEGSKADIVISHHNGGTAGFLINHVRETVAGAGVVLNISEVSRMKDDCAMICGNYVKQQADSKVGAMNIWFEGGVTRVNGLTALEGRGCESNLYGLYFGTGEQRVDVNMRVEHLVPECESYQMVKAIVSDNAVGAFTGRVYVAKDAQRTVALQQSRNLQLSDAAKIYTEPQLEIYADDVKCSHGATVGQMDSEAVYYMRQRGISEEDARRLQMFGFVNDIISKCHIDGVCDFVRDLAERRIEEL